MKHKTNKTTGIQQQDLFFSDYELPYDSTKPAFSVLDLHKTHPHESFLNPPWLMKSPYHLASYNFHFTG